MRELWTELRRLIASSLLGFALSITPREDKSTVLAISVAASLSLGGDDYARKLIPALLKALLLDEANK